MSDLLPEGTYEALAYPVDTVEFGETYAQFGESPEKKTPQVVVNTEIVDGEMAGRRIAYVGYFTEATTHRTIESLRYFGFRGNDLAGAVTQKLDQKVQIVVKHETYDGRTSARVAWVNRSGGGALKLTQPMGKDALKRFAAQMKSAVTAVPDGGGGPRPAGGGNARGQQQQRTAPPARQDEPPPPSDDDGIPF